MKDTLVVYFSRKGYTRRIAQDIARREDADILELQTTERTEGILGFWWCGRFGMHRMEMPLKPYDVDVSAYGRVILVSPVWVFSACAPIYTFARKESGRVKRAGYYFVHCSPVMRFTKTAAALDKTLGVKSEGYGSAACCWGHIMQRKDYPACSYQAQG